MLDTKGPEIRTGSFGTDQNIKMNFEIGDKITVYKANDELDETFYCIRKIKDLVKDGISSNL